MHICCTDIRTDVEMDNNQDETHIDVYLDDVRPNKGDIIARHLNSLKMFFEQLSVHAATEDE